VAVPELMGPGDRLTAFGAYAADKLIGRLVRSGRFGRVLERGRLHDILVRQQIELSGHFDPKTVAPLGRKLGLDALLLGRVTRLAGGLVEISLTLVKVESGEVVAAAEERIAAGETVAGMLSRRLASSLTVVVHPPAASGMISLAGERKPIRGGGVVFRGVDHGSRVVMVSAFGYLPASKAIYLNRDATIRLDLKRDKSQPAPVRPRASPPARGFTKYRLVVRFSPAHARVYLDGAPMPLTGRGQAEMMADQGRHSLRLAAPSLGEKERSFLLDSPTKVRITLGGPDAPADQGGLLTPSAPPGLSIQVATSQRVYRVGDHLRVFFRVNRDCYLYLFHVDAHGRTQMIFPNHAHANNLVRSGVRHVLPGPGMGFSFPVTPPTGLERIKALATTDPGQAALWRALGAGELSAQARRTADHAVFRVIY